MKKIIIVLIIIMSLLVGCSDAEKAKTNADAGTEPSKADEKAEKKEEKVEAAAKPTEKPAEIPLTDEEKEMLLEVFHINADEKKVLGMYGTADVDGVLITLDEIVMLKGTDGEDLILPVWTAENTNDEEVKIFSRIMSTVIGPENSMVNTVSRPESYPVESLSRIPLLAKGESSPFYYYVSKYVKGYYVITMNNSDYSGDTYYFVFMVE